MRKMWIFNYDNIPANPNFVEEQLKRLREEQSKRFREENGSGPIPLYKELEYPELPVDQ